MRAFAFEDGAVHHTYSTYARGLDSLCTRAAPPLHAHEAPEGRPASTFPRNLHTSIGEHHVSASIMAKQRRACPDCSVPTMILN